MALIRVDNQTGTILNPIGPSDTTFTLTVPWTGSTISGANYTRMVVDPPTLGVPSFFFETIYCTVTTGSPTVNVVQRGAEGTSVQSHAAGAFWVCGPTAEDIGSVVQSVTAGTNVTVTGTATAPIINSSGGGGGGSTPFFVLGSFTTDASPAIAAAHAAAAAVGGGTVLWPSGPIPQLTTATLVGNRVTHIGMGMRATVATLGITSGTIPMIDFTGATDVVFEDIGFDWQHGAAGDTRATTTAGVNCSNTTRSGFRRCRFYRMPNYTLSSGTHQDEISEVNLFQDAGAPFTFAHVLGSNSKGGRIWRNTYHYVNIGIQMSGGTAYGVAPVQDYDITENKMDLGWLTSIATYANSGGTVSYTVVSNTSVTITDTAANFAGGQFVTDGNTFVRVMPVMATGTSGVTYDQYTVTDPAAPFSTSLTLPGMLVRTATGQFGVVTAVDSTSVLHVEEWLSDTTRDWVAPPANGSTYTLYGLYLMVLTSFTTGAGTSTLVSSGSKSTNLNHSLIDLNGVKQASVTAGTLYEVIAHVGSYPIYLSGYCRDIRINENTLKRSYGDMIEVNSGQDPTNDICERISVVDNRLVMGFDTGIYLNGIRNTALGNTAIRCGAVAIGVGGTATAGGDHTVDDNRGYDNGWTRNIGGVSQILVGGSSRNQIVNNHMEQISSAVNLIGFGQNQSGAHVTDSNYFAGNFGVNNGLGDYALLGGTATNTGWGWNSGVGWPSVSVNAETTNYTLVSTDRDQVIEVNSAGAVNVTVPTNASVPFAIGTVIEVCQTGAGLVTLLPASGVTIDNPSSLTTRIQWSTIGIRKRGTDEWVASGDLT